MWAHTAGSSTVCSCLLISAKRGGAREEGGIRETRKGTQLEGNGGKAEKQKHEPIEAHTEYSHADFDVCTHTQNAKSQKLGS